MIRLYIYVEGRTEQIYAETVLRSHLAGFGVAVEVPYWPPREGDTA